MIDQYLLLIEQIELEDEYKDRLMLNEGVVGSLLEKVKGAIKWFIDKVLGAIKKIAGIFNRKAKERVTNTANSKPNDNKKENTKKEEKKEKKKEEKKETPIEPGMVYDINDLNKLVECVKNSYSIMESTVNNSKLTQWNNNFTKLTNTLQTKISNARAFNSKVNLQKMDSAGSSTDDKSGFQDTFDNIQKLLNSEKDNIQKKVDGVKSTLDSLKNPTKKDMPKEQWYKYYDDVLAVIGSPRTFDDRDDFHKYFKTIVAGDAASNVLKIDGSVYKQKASELEKYYNTAIDITKKINNQVDANKDSISEKTTKNIIDTIKLYTDYSKTVLNVSTTFLKSANRLNTAGLSIPLVL